MPSESDLEELLLKLNQSKSEEDILNILKEIVKQYHLPLFKDRIISNPYFKSLMPDVIEIVNNDIDIIRGAIIDEIFEIDNELDRIIGDLDLIEDQNKLKELKRECISLIKEIDKKKNDLLNF
jgi:hypothetical protein